MADRARVISAFLAKSGWGAAHSLPLAGDASARRYERLFLGDRSAVLMDSPPRPGDDTADFVRIAQHLRRIGLNAPDIFAKDVPNGLLLLEDLGDDTFARVIASQPGQEGPLYSRACDVLIALQGHQAPDQLPNLSAADWAKAAMMVLDWYCYAVTGDRTDAGGLQDRLAELIAAHADGPRVLILRDYHAENLMWLPDCAGLSQVGLLDFQLAQMGQPGYDLVSLLQDARRDVSAATETAMLARFCAMTETDPARFAKSYAVLGLQRAMRILGVFARLCLVDGKPGYLAYMPRVWRQLQANLARLDLSPMTELCQDILPAPTAAALEKIAQQCASPPLR